MQDKSKKEEEEEEEEAELGRWQQHQLEGEEAVMNKLETIAQRNVAEFRFHVDEKVDGTPGLEPFLFQQLLERDLLKHCLLSVLHD